MITVQHCTLSSVEASYQFIPFSRPANIDFFVLSDDPSLLSDNISSLLVILSLENLNIPGFSADKEHSGGRVRSRNNFELQCKLCIHVLRLQID